MVDGSHFTSHVYHINHSYRVPSSDVMMTSSSSSTTLPAMGKSAKPGPGVEDVSFGDLELFLKGEQLWQLMPLFREHRVEFTDLLNMTDRDLEQVRKGLKLFVMEFAFASIIIMIIHVLPRTCTLDECSGKYPLDRSWVCTRHVPHFNTHLYM